MKKTILRAILVAGMSLIMCMVGCKDSSGCDGDTVGASSYFTYTGYSEPEYDSSTMSSHYIEMPDGVNLAIDIYLPDDGPEKASFPTVFIYTPYGRALINPQNGAVTPGHFETYKLLSYGYAVVIADFRGTGASFGSQLPADPRIGTDGKEIIDWIADQPWCDGNVGMIGQSFLGYSQLASAKNKPEALKAIIPEVILFETYTEGFRHGGISSQKWITDYSQYLNARNLNICYGTLLPALPVIDEDGDGELADEIPMMTQGNPTTFLDDYPPTYADGVERTGHFYYLATLGHTQNLTFKQMADADTYWDLEMELAPFPLVNAKVTSPGSWLADIIDSGIPVYNLGGWFDGFTRGTFKLHATMAEYTQSKMLIAPRFHIGMPEAYSAYFSYEEELYDQLFIEKLRFLDRYLKNIDNGIDQEDPVYLYVMNKGWRSEKEWPLARQQMTEYFLNEENLLSTTPSVDGADDYLVDYTHSSTYGTNDSSRWVLVSTPDDLMTRTAHDAKTLMYDTPPLESDMEVTGHPVIHLWVSSDQDYGDFYVYLTDVDEYGESVYVTEGKLRAGWKDLQEDDDQVDGGLDVLPELPWHGYAEDQFIDGVLADNQVIELEFDLVATSWVFKAGHAIRVAIACADLDNFELNPGLAPNNDVSEVPDTTITVYRTAAYPSKIVLPVIPGNAHCMCQGYKHRSQKCEGR